MGFQFPAVMAADSTEATDDAPFSTCPRERVHEFLSIKLDERWAEIERLDGKTDAKQLERWLFNALAHDAHEAAHAIPPKRIKRLPSFRRRKR